MSTRQRHCIDKRTTEIKHVSIISNKRIIKTKQLPLRVCVGDRLMLLQHACTVAQRRSNVSESKVLRERVGQATKPGQCHVVVVERQSSQRSVCLFSTTKMVFVNKLRLSENKYDALATHERARTRRCRRVDCRSHPIH